MGACRTWNAASAGLCASALIATILLVLAASDRRSAWLPGRNGTAKCAASTNAQARYLFPFFALLSCFFFPFKGVALTRDWEDVDVAFEQFQSRHRAAAAGRVSRAAMLTSKEQS